MGRCVKWIRDHKMAVAGKWLHEQMGVQVLTTPLYPVGKDFLVTMDFHVLLQNIKQIKHSGDFFSFYVFVFPCSYRTLTSKETFNILNTIVFEIWNKCFKNTLILSSWMQSEPRLKF